MADYEEIDLSALSDDELVEQMHNDLYDGMRDEIVEGTRILLGRGFTATLHHTPRLAGPLMPCAAKRHVASPSFSFGPSPCGYYGLC